MSEATAADSGRRPVDSSAAVNEPSPELSAKSGLATISHDMLRAGGIPEPESATGGRPHEREP
jgi:hypothetical protein